MPHHYILNFHLVFFNLLFLQNSINIQVDSSHLLTQLSPPTTLHPARNFTAASDRTNQTLRSKSPAGQTCLPVTFISI